MKVITTKQIKSETETYFELAEKERIVVKMGDKFINLIVTDHPDNFFVDEKWIRDFFAIPDEHRCNPFDISPSGDLFWADKRNVEHVKETVKDNSATVKVNSTKELRDFLDSL